MSAFSDNGSTDPRERITLDQEIGRNITTGNGRDRIKLIGGGSHTIDTGDGDDAVTLEYRSNNNDIFTGAGDDTVDLEYSEFDYINTGAGADTVNLSKNNDNTILTGAGADTVDIVYGFDLQIETGDGADTVDLFRSSYNDIETGDGPDTVNPYRSDDLYIDTGDGDDLLYAISSGDLDVTTGAGSDSVLLYRTSYSDVATGEGDDFVFVGGKDSRIDVGDGSDIVRISSSSTNTTVAAGRGSDIIQFITDEYDELGGSIAGGDGVDVIVRCDAVDESVVRTSVEIELVVECFSRRVNQLLFVSVDEASGKVAIDGTTEPLKVLNKGAQSGSFSVTLCSSGGATTLDDLVNVDSADVVLTECDTSVVGDPHFVGFDGLKFDYTGRPGSSFNLIATFDIIVNALLAPDLVNGLTYMSAIGVRTHDIKCRVAAFEGRLVVHINEAEITQPVTHLPGGVEVVLEGAVTVRTPQLVVTLAVHEQNFVDLTSVHLIGGAPDVVHGVLGQTAIAARGTQGYEGQEEDYIVSSLWVDDFTYGHVFEKSGSPSAPPKLHRRMGDAFAGHLDTVSTP